MPTAIARTASAPSGRSGSSASTRLRREHDLSYNRFMAGVKRAGIELDRKSLADIAVSDPQAFAAVAERAKAALASDAEAA